MPIHSCRITDFRNIPSVELNPSTQGLNILSGENGSGKTNLLEALYYLSVAKSFRQASSRCLIRHGEREFALFADVTNQHARQTEIHRRIGMQRATIGGFKLRVGDVSLTSMTELAYLLPMRVIHSQSHHFFELGPVFRRKYLDWGLFYHHKTFLGCWQHYMRMLKQRNAALRQQRPRHEIEIWTAELLRYGLEFDALRRQYVADLAPLIINLAQELLSIESLQISYEPGFESKDNFAMSLKQTYVEDRRLGYTQLGPHKADITIAHQGRPVKHTLSRGQQKLLICAMIIAQGQLLTIQNELAPIYLVDDLPAELDKNSRKKLLTVLSKQGTQIFMTAIEDKAIREEIDLLVYRKPVKVFHVEHGRVRDISSSSN